MLSCASHSISYVKVFSFAQFDFSFFGSATWQLFAIQVFTPILGRMYA
jgi:hypothetical protein